MGRPKKKVVEEPKAKVPEQEPLEADPSVEAAKKADPGPCNADQRYFEAPDGTIIVGEKSATRIWYRGWNNGEGCWIRPKR